MRLILVVKRAIEMKHFISIDFSIHLITKIKRIYSFPRQNRNVTEPTAFR